MSETRFMTFPVALLKDAFIDISKVCNNAINYAIYSKALNCAIYAKSETIDEIEEALTFYGLSLSKNGTFENQYKRGKVLYDSFDGSASPMVSVNKDILYHFREQPKTEFEIAVFCAFCAVRSIIGIDPYKKATNDFLIARMFGYRSVEEFKNLKTKPDYWQKCFSTDGRIRHHLTNKIIIGELESNWGLKYYSSRSRGFYVSFKLDFEALVMQAERRKKKFKDKERSDAKNAVIKKVIHNLNQ